MGQTFDWQNTRQLSVPLLVLSVAAPSAVAFAGFHVVLPSLVARGVPVLIAWPSVASVMLLGLVVVALALMRREARAMGITLASRMCLKTLSGKEWGLYLAVAVAGLVAVGAAQGLVPPFMRALRLSVPAYMPFFLNPAIDPTTANMSVLSPGLPLRGSYGILPLMTVTLLLNILTEELYFRAWMLPKLVRFGGWSWVMNGVLFALYHSFQIWLLPALLVASLCFAFIFYRAKSLWPPFSAHLVGNFLFSILGIVMLVFR